MHTKLDYPPSSTIALLADIHGNPIALDAVLSDIANNYRVDGYWFLGDYAALGFDPSGIIERLERLPGAHFIRGNTDRYVTDGDSPFPTLEDAKNKPELIEHHTRIARSFAWTAGALSSKGWLEWLAKLPLEIRFELPDGTRVLLVHASPGNDDGDGLHPGLSDAEFLQCVNGAGADLLIIGHTHLPFDRQIDKIRVVNPGSVSNPIAPDTRASYGILSLAEDHYHIHLRRVAFDLIRTIEATKAVNHPSWRYIEQFMQGKRRPDWELKRQKFDHSHVTNERNH